MIKRRMTATCYFAAGAGGSANALCYLWWIIAFGNTPPLHWSLWLLIILAPHALIAVSAWLSRHYHAALVAVLLLSLLSNSVILGFVLKHVPQGWPHEFGRGWFVLVPLFQAAFAVLAFVVGALAGLMSDHKRLGNLG